MALFSIKPTMSLKGRRFKGLRDFAGKPFHPPRSPTSRSRPTCWRRSSTSSRSSPAAIPRSTTPSSSRLTLVGLTPQPATYTLIAGGVVSLPTALTGFWDWRKSTESGTQAWRTANRHMAVMLTVTALVLVDIIVRLAAYDTGFTTVPVLVLSVVIGALVSYGAAYGGALVYEYGFNVETAGDSPAWHVSDVDLMHGQDRPTSAG